MLAPIGSAQARIDRARVADGERSDGDAEHSQSDEDQDRDGDRDAAALARRARFAQRGETDQSGGESVKRAGEAIRQFAAEPPSHLSRLLVVRVVGQQFQLSSARAAA